MNSIILKEFLNSKEIEEAAKQVIKYTDNNQNIKYTSENKEQKKTKISHFQTQSYQL